MSHSPKIQGSLSEFNVSAWPWMTSSNVSAVKEHAFPQVASFCAVKNTGASGSLYFSFTSTGFASYNYFVLSAGETITLPHSITKLYVSGTAAQPYSVCAGLTDMDASLWPTISTSTGFEAV
jgi:hypothetical protein